MPRENNNKILIFGAGNIGRSFLAQVFSRNNYAIVFVDINQNIIDLVQTRKKYEVITLYPDGTKSNYTVKNIQAVHADETDKVMRELLEADLVATSVGKSALPNLLPIIMVASKLRTHPLNIILAENIRNGAAEINELVQAEFTKIGEPEAMEAFRKKVCFLETSIGKMVPLQEDHSSLNVYCEPYNILIVSGKNYLGEKPDVEEIHWVDNINAWVDKKLFIHNLGHASLAYYTRSKYPNEVYLYKGLLDFHIKWKVKQVMLEAGNILLAEYSDIFTETEIKEHIGDLIKRFQNPYLKDTVTRVGQDLSRKLHKKDRILGAIILGKQHALPYSFIMDAFLTALEFEKREVHNRDSEINRRYLTTGLREILLSICGLAYDNPLEHELIQEFLA